jgi:hypothetical protein
VRVCGERAEKFCLERVLDVAGVNFDSDRLTKSCPITLPHPNFMSIMWGPLSQLHLLVGSLQRFRLGSAEIDIIVAA